MGTQLGDQNVGQNSAPLAPSARAQPFAEAPGGTRLLFLRLVYKVTLWNFLP